MQTWFVFVNGWPKSRWVVAPLACGAVASMAGRKRSTAATQRQMAGGKETIAALHELVSGGAPLACDAMIVNGWEENNDSREWLCCETATLWQRHWS